VITFDSAAWAVSAALNEKFKSALDIAHIYGIIAIEP